MGGGRRGRTRELLLPGKEITIWHRENPPGSDALDAKRGGMLVRPGGEVLENFAQRLAEIRERVALDSRVIVRGLPNHKALLYHASQSVGKHLVADSRNQVPQLRIPARPLAEAAQQGTRPLALE